MADQDGLEAIVGTGRMVSIGAFRLRVFEAGPADGSPLILLHGFPEFWWAWRRQIAPLAARGHRVIVPDLPGYGGSDIPAGRDAFALDTLAADIIGLADACGIDRFDLVGHDWGGIVAWAVASRYPQRAKRLVAIAAPHADTATAELIRHPTQIARSAYVGMFQLPLLPEAMLRAFRFAALRNTLTTSSRSGTFTPDELDRYVAAWSGPGRLTAMLSYYRALRLAKPLGRLAQPVSILWGGQDLFLGTHLAEAARAMCDEASVAVLPDATHWIHLEEPDWITDRIAEFCTPD